VVGKNYGKIMIGKSEKLCLTLLLSLTLANISSAEVYANNTLNQVDIRKSSPDGLEFTLYTSSPYADNVVVTKKSDNKYVILMPNVNGASNSKPDFSAVKDIVTDIDVRAVKDEGNGFTKVTIITNRPVDIKTNTAKSAVPTQGQKEYRALIAQQQAKASAAGQPQKTPAQPQQATAQTQKTSAQPQKAPVQQASALKLPEIQPTKSASDIVAEKKQKPAAAAPASTSVANSTAKPQTPAVKTPAKAVSEKLAQNTPAKKQDTKSVQPKKDSDPVKPVANKTAEQQKPEQKSVQKSEAQITEQPKSLEKPAVQVQETIPETELSVETIEQEIAGTAPAAEAPIAAEVQQKFTSSDFENKLADIKNKFSGRIPENMPVTLALVLIPLICIMVLFNIIKASLQRSQMLKKVMMENMARRQNIEPSSYDNIINNENLSWQEKYQQYREIANDTEEIEQQPQYNFIAKPQNIAPVPPVRPSAEPENRVPQSIYTKGVINNPKKNKNADNLERILQASPSIEKTEIARDIIETESRPAKEQNVASEDNSIHHEITKSVKFKAFEEKMILEETCRNKKVKHRRIQIELPKEAPHVNLGYSQLHTNPRSLQGANLSVSDLIAKSNKLLNIKQEPEEPKVTGDYEMVSVDEYLSMLDDEKSKVTSPLSDIVADKLSKMKDRSDLKPVSQTATNPITSLRNETKTDYLNGLIVKSGFNIDSERGFYLVSMDGKSAVIGRVGEEIYVLKKFDRNINKPLQVRMDNPNVYMVKADNFRSLVEVRKNDMDVLIEL